MGEDVGGGLHEFQVAGVRAVEVDGLGGALKAGPEQLAVLGFVVQRERVEQLGDLVVEDILEHVLGKFDTSLVRMLLLDFNELFDAFKSHPQGNWFLKIRFVCTFLSSLTVLSRYSLGFSKYLEASHGPSTNAPSK
jgi:hypothetical protein